ncbi:MAG TPA: NAD(P)/FAD-dependent oxidoreductase [Candidatus Baltobacteraceae bacterium]|nr:NAD(P)/FAD-dependent oxidoreductase [Candidatus Baltobacteraceae bacterium]
MTDKEVRESRKPVVVIIGGGFAGIKAARALKGSNAEIILIDRRNHHIFQPLLYQVATAFLSPADIAAPIRQIEETQANVSVALAEVTGIDVASQTVSVYAENAGTRTLSFDYLVVATGAQSTYFGHDEFAEFAPSLKTLADAEEIRAKILRGYEIATVTADPAERSRQLTFAIVGGGPTGVELAASLATMARDTLRGNFRGIDPSQSKIVLIEAGKRVLPQFHESLAAKAVKHLESLGVQILTASSVEHVDARGLVVNGNRIEAATVLWAAGVAVSPILKMLGAPTDRGGRVIVDAQLRVPGTQKVFVVGDAANITQGNRPLPGVAQVAIQSGSFVGRLIAAQVKGEKPTKTFSYFNKGNLAVVGKNYALLERDNVRVSGFFAWLVWALIHITFLPQLQNRLGVGVQWLYSYFTGRRGARLIPEGSSEQRLAGAKAAKAS